MKSVVKIKFPVVRKLVVEDYALFPGRGKEEPGIHHDFLKGVNLVIGINGLGKTTLLNVIYRLLIGPKDPSKDELQFAGAKSHKLIDWRNRSYFSSRVGDGADAALASAEISFGNEILRITRSLSDLSVVSLSLGDREFENTQEEYEDLCVRLCGVGSFFDFQYLVRNMVFFLEERRSLIWEEQGQFEIFRILFSTPERAQTLSLLYDDIKDLDSRYRNLNWHVNRKEKSVIALRRKQDASDTIVEKYEALTSAKQGLEKKADDFISKINAVIEEKDDLIVRLEQQKLELEQAQRVCEGMQRRYFSKSFPKLPETVEYLFAHLVSDSGCLVCGSSGLDGAERLRKLMKENQCPVCESPPDLQERADHGAKVVGVQTFSAKAINNELKKVGRLSDSVESLSNHCDEIDTKLRLLYQQRAANQVEIDKIVREASRLKIQLAPSEETVEKLEREITADKNQLAEIRVELNSMRSNYDELLASARSVVETFTSQIAAKFSEYASHFLTEECSLSYRPTKRSIGESGPRFEWPGFEVLMTSSVFGEPTPRRNFEQVSESQKEFIDLSFRMALMASVSADDSDYMLVMETPEASLDAVFVDQAAELLRKFANQGQGKGNVLIASTNITEGSLLGSLLKGRAKDKKRRVINLLEVGAPNAALKKYRSQYEKQIETVLG